MFFKTNMHRFCYKAGRKWLACLSIVLLLVSMFPAAAFASTNAVTVSITSLNASKISASGVVIDINLAANSWNPDICINGITGPIFTNLYPTLKSCFTTTANSTEWSTLLDSANFQLTSTTNMKMTILPQPYNIQLDQTVTFTPQTSLLKDLVIGAPAIQPTFDIKADFATLSGSLITGATQSKIISGGQELIIDLTNCKWDATINANPVKKAALIAGLVSSADDATEWVKVRTALNAVTNPIVLSNGNSTMTITLPAVPDYKAYVPQTITLSSLDMTLITDNTPAPYSVPITNIINNSFGITPDAAGTTIEWVVPPILTELNLTEGFFVDTLSMTLGNNTWADIAGDVAKQKALLEGFTTSTDIAAWNNVKNAILAVGATAFVRSNTDKTLTITIPAVIAGGYSISTNQTVDVNVPPTVLTNNYPASPNPLSFTIKADPAVAVSGTLTAGVNEIDIVNGGKTIVATLTNATWDPLVTTDILKREKLIDDLLSSVDPFWTAAIITTIKAGATYTLDDALSAVTITLPPVPGFNITSNLVISSQMSAPSNTLPSFTQSLTPSFTIAPVINQSATIFGTVTTATESDIVTGGKTLVITLGNDVWAQDVVSTPAKRTALIYGIENTDTTNTIAWNNVQSALELSSTSVVRTSDTELTIDFPQVLGYVLNSDQSINVTIPSSTLSTTTAAINAGTFTIKAVTATLSGTAVTTPLDSTTVATGGKTIIITLKNATWASDVTTASRRDDLLAQFSSSANWNNIRNKITPQNITLSGNSVLTITLPPAPPVLPVVWSATPEEVTFSINSSLYLEKLINENLGSGRILTASPTVKIGQASITTTLLGTATAMAVADVVQGGKIITIKLNGGSWDPLMQTNSAKISTLVSGFTADSDSTSWALVQTALKSSSTIANHAYVLSTTGGTTNDTLTITLPPVPSYDPVKSQTVSLKIPKAVIVSATADVTAAGSIQINLSLPISKGTLQSLLGDGLVNLLKSVPLQQIYLVVPTKYITSVVSKQSPLGSNTINSLDIYTNSSVTSVNVLVNGTNYSSILPATVENGKKFNVGFATINPTTGSTLPYDAIISTGPITAKSTETIKIGGSRTTTFTDLGGNYSMYKLINNSSLLTNILKYYAPTDITVKTP